MSHRSTAKRSGGMQSAKYYVGKKEIEKWLNYPSIRKVCLS
jgi:hypothetical protein